SDLDQDLLLEYSKTLKIDDRSSDYGFLKSRGCLKEVDNIFYPTYAGLLLFGMNPQQWLPTASILAVRFPGSTLSDTFVKQEISGNLIQQLKKAEIFIGDHTPRKSSISGMQRIEEEIYPLDVVRELVVNAITHRDYNNQGDHIHLHLYSDRLFVRSPGELPGPVTLENLLDIRYSRNPVIA
ncbi:MAG: transcriptional regulator, partial [candidate division Zixibacteria bacterium]|nr:transcriptional regulator [candidate division Zixibacteria bacterium]NIS49114.1 transcriptional regulator [candidate division Zixibacteria bacterium]NIU17209.1 transcriptional regulator [candidate division Zixibacteria bacterium]NIV09329.1 transcriptional regulator [candidate division Zixibacteria bacterium]NIW40019.1 transcriptional regulator [candidate division Zixibacteria bacterium]